MNQPQPLLRIGVEKEILKDRSVAVVRLEGVVDETNAQHLRQTLLNSLEENDIRYIVLDLTGLERVTSSGIGGLMAVSRWVAEKHGDIVMAGVHGEILQLFKLLGFTTYYRTAKDAEEAKALLRADGQSTSEVFPRFFPCPSCSKSLKASRVGKFKCPSCGTLLTVDPTGGVSTQS